MAKAIIAAVELDINNNFEIVYMSRGLLVIIDTLYVEYEVSQLNQKDIIQ